MSKKKPCPFCGSENLYHKLVLESYQASQRVTCRNCGAQGPEAIEDVASGERAAKGVATKGWNRRAEGKGNG